MNCAVSSVYNTLTRFRPNPALYDWCSTGLIYSVHADLVTRCHNEISLFLPAQRYASAGNSDRNVSVRPSVYQSVTRRYNVLRQNEERSS